MVRGGQADEGKGHPDEGKPPHDEAKEDANDVENLCAAGRVEPGDAKGVCVAKALQRDLAELLDAEAALAEGPDGEEDGDDDLARGQRVDGQAVEVEGDDAGGEGLADAPEDVRGDEGGEDVVRVRQGLGDDAARGGRDDGGDNGQQEGGGGVLQTGLVAVHDDEGHADAGGHGEEDVDPPECPGEVDDPGTPVLAAKDHHVDDGCDGVYVSVLQRGRKRWKTLTGKAHGETAEKEGLRRVRNQDAPNLRVHRVAKDADKGKEAKEEDVEAEEDVRNVLDPDGVVGEVVEEDGDDARAHVYGKPSLIRLGQFSL